VLVIGGYVNKYRICLATVSYYNIASNTWKNGLPRLNEARWDASACVLQATVYVFCGLYNNNYKNSIEMISETSLVPKSNALWQLIETPQNILTPRQWSAVSPISDTEIAILGGKFDIEYLGDVVVFNSKTKKCVKVDDSNGEFKFYASIN